MIDDKKIEEAANLYRFELIASMHNPYQCFEEEVDAEAILIEDSFISGAKWAINEFLKNLWNPASEIPTKPNASILAKAIYDIEEDTPLKYPFYYITYTPPCDMFAKKPSEEWNKRSSIIGISDWLYVDDLLPKEGGEE